MPSRTLPLMSRSATLLIFLVLVANLAAADRSRTSYRQLVQEDKPVAYCHNALNKARTGNSSPRTFWCFSYQQLLKNYPEIFSLPDYTCNTCPDCSNLPPVPYWVGLMPGRWIPRNGSPTDYISMEIGGYGGLKDYERLTAADEYTQRLLDNHFFEQ